MLIISVKRVSSKLDSLLKPYLFRVKAGLYIGQVTRRLLDYFLEEIPKTSSSEVILIWSNLSTVEGFEVFEIGGGAKKRVVDIDGLNFFLN